MNDAWSQKVVDFLREIGIEVIIQSGAEGFIEHIQIQQGKLLVDPDSSPSALLHEAGHVAIVPPSFWHLLDGDLEQSFERIFDEVRSLHLAPDHPLARAVLQSSETEATAWSWAAGKHLGIPDNLIIEDKDFDKSGKIVRFQLQNVAHYGIQGLIHAGFCSPRYREGPKYPQLLRWIQESFDDVANLPKATKTAKLN